MYAVQIEGTWMYIMRTVLPCTTSSAENHNPHSASVASMRMTTIPSRRVAEVPVPD
jgi:hypothetical protein